MVSLIWFSDFVDTNNSDFVSSPVFIKWGFIHLLFENAFKTFTLSRCFLEKQGGGIKKVHSGGFCHGGKVIKRSFRWNNKGNVRHGNEGGQLEELHRLWLMSSAVAGKKKCPTIVFREKRILEKIRDFCFWEDTSRNKKFSFFQLFFPKFFSSIVSTIKFLRDIFNLGQENKQVWN